MYSFLFKTELCKWRKDMGNEEKIHSLKKIKKN